MSVITSCRALVILFLLLGCQSAFAGNDPVYTTSLLGRNSEVVAGGELTVSDVRFATSRPQIEKTFAISNMVWLGIDEQSPHVISSDFSVTVNVRIYRTDTSAVVDSFDKALVINYKKANGEKYDAMAYHNFSGGVEVKVKILSITKNVSWDVTKVLQLKNEIQLQRDWLFDCSMALTFNTGTTIENGEWVIGWTTPSVFVDEYDLEWAWLDRSALLNYYTGGVLDVDKVFDNNATRITTTNLNYKIPLLYDDSGWIYVRVRPVRNKINGQRVEGAWACGNGSEPKKNYEFTGHERLLNWQATTTFAEEGKRKSVVQYFDGSLRGRQTVTKDNTTNTSVVAETFYDYQGRPVIQVLPSPTISSIIAFTKNFNQFDDAAVEKSVYDKLTTNESPCTKLTARLATTTGASRYYSPGNTMAGIGPHSSIPDAEGYPYTETRYTKDGTGRIDAQGGVGITHQVNNGHDTKYLYEAPAQEQLDALFGTDIGYASHYFKNWVKDANGQYSVSYVDMQGRTVATALAGAVPANLKSLPSAATAEQRLTRQLIDPETNRIVGKSIVSSKPLIVPQENRYTFEYSLTPANLGLLNCDSQTVCYDCYYRLKITIVPDCADNAVPNQGILVIDSNFTLGGAFPNNCNEQGNSPGLHFIDSLILPEGAYTVIKELSIAQEAQNYYRDSVFIPGNTCKSLEDYINTQYNLALLQSNCNITCASCTDSLGTYENFRDRFATQSGLPPDSIAAMDIEIQAAYKEAASNCEQLCLKENPDGFDEIRSIRQMMLNDVTPPYGQYARTDDPDTTPENESQKLYNIFTPSFRLTAPFRRPSVYSPVAGLIPTPYRDEYGRPLETFSSDVQGGRIGINDFSNSFFSSYAEQLLPHHPEYCKLVAAETKLRGTYNFAMQLEKTNTWAEALTKGYIDNILNKDSLFLNSSMPGWDLRDDMDIAINTKYLPGQCSGSPFDISMWRMAQYTVLCRKELAAAGNVDCATAVMACLASKSTGYPTDITGICTADLNMIWRNFRTFYLSYRRELLSQWYSNPANLNCVGIGMPTNSDLRELQYAPRFINTAPPGNSGWQEVDDMINGATTNNYEAQMAAEADSTCRANAGTWMLKLRQCTLLDDWIDGHQTQWTTDSTNLTNTLTNICKEGYDFPGHPFGASSLPTAKASVNGYRDFPAVIHNYLTITRGFAVDAICHPYLIDFPAPYNQAPATVNFPVITKPDSCTCARITELKNEWQTSGVSGSFSAYLQSAHGTTIADDSLQLLLDLCSGVYTCNFLEKPFVLPSVFQCRGTADSVKTCINCEDMAKIRADFAIVFHAAAPVSNPQTYNEVALNKAFEKFANFKTGFSKSWTDYAAFTDSCASYGDTLVVSGHCDSLKQIKKNFAAVYADFQNGSAYKNVKLTPCTKEVIRAGNALIEARANTSNPSLSDPAFCVRPTTSSSPGLPFHAIAQGWGSAAPWYNAAVPLELSCAALGQEFPDLEDSIPAAADFCNGVFDPAKRYYAVSLLDLSSEFRIIWSSRANPTAYAFYGASIPNYKFVPQSANENHVFGLFIYEKPDNVVTPAQYQSYYSNLGSYPLISHDSIRRILDVRIASEFITPSSFAGGVDGGSGKFVKVILEMQNGTVREGFLSSNYNDYFAFKETADSNLYNPDCKAAFAYYYNQQTGLSLTYEQIQAQYKECGIPLSLCGPADTIINCSAIEADLQSYYSQYVDPASGYVDMPMRTFYGNVTPAEGNKGVFDVNGQLIGNTDGNTIVAVNKDFAKIWNSSTVNRSVGRLMSLPNGRFRLYLEPGQEAPCQGIIGQRFYQFDANNTTIQNYYNVGYGSYIDFGDGHHTYVNDRESGDSTVVTHSGTLPYSSYAHFDHSFRSYGVRHIYPSSASRTVTVYHTDRLGYVSFDKNSGLVGNTYQHIRGYFPQEMYTLSFHATTDSTLHDFSRIENFQQIGTIEQLDLQSHSRWDCVSNIWFTSLANNHNMKSLWLEMDAVNPIAGRKPIDNWLPDIHINFPNLNNFRIVPYDSAYSSQLNLAIPTLRTALISVGPGGSPYKITTSQIDQIITQISSGSLVNNGSLIFGTNGTMRSSASDAAVANLTARGWQLSGAGMSVAGSYVGFPAATAPNINDSLPESNGFTDFFNAQHSTSYTYPQLLKLYDSLCGKQLDICNIVPSPPNGGSSGLLLCGLNKPVFDNPITLDTATCKDPYDLAVTVAEEKYELYLDSLRGNFDVAYYEKCMTARAMESFTVTSKVVEHHYTLYYYDQAGNLLKTVPPEGVHPIYTSGHLDNVRASRAINGIRVAPEHTMLTQYRYNTLGQVIAQISPDGGTSHFWYDVLGRLVVSQNEKQEAADDYSYTLYDELGRIKEVGQLEQTTAMDQATSQSPALLGTWLSGKAAEQVTITRYDLPYGYSLSSPDGVLVEGMLRQRNLRNRVSYSAVYDETTVNTHALGSQASASFYTYDIHGNVDTLLQDYNTGMGQTAGNRFKKIIYDYDLVSGKVNQVAYQPGKKDQFYHRYLYDAENRIIQVFTSHDRLIWEQDATYGYYKHGPLARTVLGQQLVQGLDYAYTLQGWLKGVNSTAVNQNFDIGGDGLNGEANATVARDVYGFSLNYYNYTKSAVNYNDYKPIGGGSAFAGVLASLSSNAASLYNGNIAAMAVNVPKLGEPMVYAYRYDQLNRIREMDAWKGLSNSTNILTPAATNEFKERISYDANGNILSYLRNGTTKHGKPLGMDSLTYNYINGTNKLEFVSDDVASGNYKEDIDAQLPGNYEYDAIGNMTKDVKEGITAIKWTVYGKIEQITKTVNSVTTTINYTYDAAGNRISKDVNGKKTWYVRDASGNTMGLYEEDNSELNSGHLTQTEVHLYGSSRLGIFKVNRDMETVPDTATVHVFARGNKLFELSNHLGNVLVTLSDKKAGVDSDTDGDIDYYTADVMTANDYYPFGMQMPGRDNKELDEALESGENSSLTMGTGAGSGVKITEASNNFTIELWVKPTSTHQIDVQGDRYGGVVGQKFVIDGLMTDWYGYGHAGVGISVGNNGVSVYEHAGDYFQGNLVWEGTLSDWTHVAVIYDNRTPKLYINGTLVKTGYTSTMTDLYPGTLVASGQYGTMDGQIDEVRVWNYVRSQAEIAAHMNGTVPTPQDGLVAYWPINTGDGGVLKDITGNGYDVTLNSSYNGANWSNIASPISSYRDGYRYGFNGKEQDKETTNTTTYDYGFRIYNPALGRFLSVDPLSNQYPFYTPYQFAGNTPIMAIDLDGLEIWAVNPSTGETAAGPLYMPNYSKEKGWVSGRFASKPAPPIPQPQTQKGPTLQVASESTAQGKVQIQTKIALSKTAPKPKMANQTTVSAVSYVEKAEMERQEIKRSFNERMEGATMDQFAAQQILMTANTGAEYLKMTISHGVEVYEGVTEGDYWKATKNSAFLALDIAPFVPLKGMGALSAAERGIVKEADAILGAAEFETLRAAQKSGTFAEVTIGGRKIIYEPGLPSSGFTLMGENGFVLGNEAFKSSSELGKTLLHELHRLKNSAIPESGLSAGGQAASETNNAYQFAEKASQYLKNN